MIRFLRALLSGFFFVSYGVAALPFAVLLLLPIWPASAVRWVIRLFYRVFVFFAHLTRLYRVRVDAETKAKLRGCKGCIVVANHVSLIDICILFAHLPDSTALAKAQARRNPFLGMVVRKMFIANDENPEVTIEKARKYLEKGINVVIFPQGTRGGTSLKRGAARLALATGGRISAFWLDYDPVVLAKGQPWWDMGEREIVIEIKARGEIVPQGESSHAAAVALTNLIGEKIK